MFFSWIVFHLWNKRSKRPFISEMKRKCEKQVRWPHLHPFVSYCSVVIGNHTALLFSMSSSLSPFHALILFPDTTPAVKWVEICILLLCDGVWERTGPACGEGIFLFQSWSSSSDYSGEIRSWQWCIVKPLCLTQVYKPQSGHLLAKDTTDSERFEGMQKNGSF